MKRTIFYDTHKSLNAKLVSFAGYEMPVEYTGVTDEHHTVRNAVGVFDVSHMGTFWVKGPGALNLLQKVTSNDVAKLTPGKVQYSYIPNIVGGIVDDLLVYQYDEEKYLLVVNASNIEKDWVWINEYNTFDAQIEDSSEQISQLAIQGPLAVQTLQKLTSVNLSDIPYYSFKVGDFAGVNQVILSNTGYTGSGGFEIYFKNEDGARIWDAIFEAGKEFGIKPIGLAARDTLRLEMGYCLYGVDINDHTSPFAAGLGWITKFADGKDFIGREQLEQQLKSEGKYKLVGFEMLEKAIPRHDYMIVDDNEREIGYVTSGTMSPTLKKGIGMGYVRLTHAELGKQIRIIIRNKIVPAKVVNLPFYSK
jgi:aminomethyltransferase